MVFGSFCIADSSVVGNVKEFPCSGNGVSNFEFGLSVTGVYSHEGIDSVIDELAEKAWGSTTSLSLCLGNGNLVPGRSLS